MFLECCLSLFVVVRCGLLLFVVCCRRCRCSCLVVGSCLFGVDCCCVGVVCSCVVFFAIARCCFFVVCLFVVVTLLLVVVCCLVLVGLVWVCSVLT